MSSSHSGDSDDSYNSSDDLERSRAVPNTLSRFQDNYESDLESARPCTPQKQFKEEDGQSYDSAFHTLAQ